MPGPHSLKLTVYWREKIQKPGLKSHSDHVKQHEVCLVGVSFMGWEEGGGVGDCVVGDGGELWRRTDRKCAQRVASLISADEIFCRCGDPEALLLCAHTGRNLDIPHGIKDMHSSPFSKTV